MKIHSLASVTLALALAHSSIALADPPSTSAYATDVQNSHVEDATSRGIGQVNMIACIMGALRPDATANGRRYNAIGGMKRGDAAKGESSEDGSGASQATTYATATVNSTRASNTEPMR